MAASSSLAFPLFCHASVPFVLFSQTVACIPPSIRQKLTLSRRICNILPFPIRQIPSWEIVVPPWANLLLWKSGHRQSWDAFFKPSWTQLSRFLWKSDFPLFSPIHPYRYFSVHSHISYSALRWDFYASFLLEKNLPLCLKEDYPYRNPLWVFRPDSRDFASLNFPIPSLSFYIPAALVLLWVCVFPICQKSFPYRLEQVSRDDGHLRFGVDSWVLERDNAFRIGSSRGDVKSPTVCIFADFDCDCYRFALTNLEYHSRIGFGGSSRISESKYSKNTLRWFLVNPKKVLYFERGVANFEFAS